MIKVKLTVGIVSFLYSGDSYRITRAIMALVDEFGSVKVEGNK